MKTPGLVTAVVLLLAGSAPAQESRPASQPWRAEVRVVDDHGTPVPDVLVRARLPFAIPYSDLARKNFEARSDASGLAAFDDLLPEEPVVFEVSHASYVPTRSAVTLPHRSAPDPNASGPSPTQLVLTTGRSVSLTVTDTLGSGLGEVEVRVLPLVEPRSERAGPARASESRGSTRIELGEGVGRAFEGLPAELLTFEVRKPGFETRMIVVDLRKDMHVEAAVSLDRDPNPPGKSIPWMGSVREAFATAAAAGVPVMLAMAMDGERANDWIAEHHFKDPEVVRVAEFLPCLISSAFGAGGLNAETVSHDEREGECTRYGSVPCAVHRAVEEWARAEVMTDIPSFPVPRHVFITAEGREVDHRAYALSERELRWMILRALRSSDSDAAIWLALRRLKPLWLAVCSDEETAERAKAIEILPALINSGDEYATLLLQGFGLEQIPRAAKIEILSSLIVPALRDPVRALSGFLRDADPQLRLRAWQRLSEHPARLDVGAAVACLDPEDDGLGQFSQGLSALRVRETGTFNPDGTMVVADPTEGDRWMIVEMLLDNHLASSISGLDAVLEAHGTNGRNRLLRALAKYDDDESATRRLLAAAAAEDASAVPAIRALSHTAVEAGSRTAALFLTQARAQNPLVRQEALGALGARSVAGSIPVLEAALEDPVAPVRIEAAIGLWRQGNRKGAAVLASGVDDPELGAEVSALLGAAYSDAMPTDADGWRKWLSEQGIPAGR